MSDGIVIDASIIPKFYQELRVERGFVYKIVTWLSNNCGIAINDFISNEWERLCSAPLFNDWYTDELKNGRIRKIGSTRIPEQYKRKMRDEYGFPCRSRDFKYIECAHSTDKTKYIMTEDYHFYDPKCDKQSRSRKQLARERRQGRFCKFLANALGIRVGMPIHCKSDFSIP